MNLSKHCRRLSPEKQPGRASSTGHDPGPPDGRCQSGADANRPRCLEEPLAGANMVPIAYPRPWRPTSNFLLSGRISPQMVYALPQPGDQATHKREMGAPRGRCRSRALALSSATRITRQRVIRPIQSQCPPTRRRTRHDCSSCVFTRSDVLTILSNSYALSPALIAAPGKL